MSDTKIPAFAKSLQAEVDAVDKHLSTLQAQNLEAVKARLKTIDINSIITWMAKICIGWTSAGPILKLVVAVILRFKPAWKPYADGFISTVDLACAGQAAAAKRKK